MSKKKKKNKKKKESLKFLKEIDGGLNGTHDEIMKEISEIQRNLYIADQKALKKQKKALKQKIRTDMGVIPYYTSKERVRAREVAIKEMERTNLLGRIENLFKSLAPCIIILSRLVAALITSILSVESIVRVIKPETVKKMDKVYKLAMSIR